MDIDARLDMTSKTSNAQLLVVEAAVLWPWHAWAHHFRHDSRDVGVVVHLILLVAARRQCLYNLRARSLALLRA